MCAENVRPDTFLLEEFKLMKLNFARMIHPECFQGDIKDSDLSPLFIAV